MKVKYISHSGFLVETEKYNLIFDYYKGTLPQIDKCKPTVVFCSHSHPDHFNPKVFTKLEEQGVKNIVAVLAKDISKSKYPRGIEVVRATADEEFELDNGLKFKTLLSTDCGVAFLVYCDDGIIYHAGDLNDWSWAGESEQYNKQMAGNYRHEIDKLKGINISIAFIPLDPRQEENYAKGILYFLENCHAEKIYPMHYWNQPEIIDKFKNEYPQYSQNIINTEKEI